MPSTAAVMEHTGKPEMMIIAKCNLNGHALLIRFVKPEKLHSVNMKMPYFKED